MMDGEWHSSTPDGRELVIQRRDSRWMVSCGRWHALSLNLDVALMGAIRGDAESATQRDETDCPVWARALADKIESPA
jgi:hypothetical protein